VPLFYLVPARQDGGIRLYLRSWGRDFAERMRVLPYEELPALRALTPGTYILSALDQLGPAMLRLVCELRDALDGQPGFRFLNDPSSTLFRRELLDELHGRGLNAFRAVRANGDLAGLRFPVFLRSEHGHDGALSPLLESQARTEEASGRALLRGRRLDDLLVVEFCPTADRHGRYRKYAAFGVGDRVVPRHLASGGDWMLKYDTGEQSPEIAQEELDYVRTNPHREHLAEIFEIARVDYGRIDYSMWEGRIQTWEINLNPVIGYALPRSFRRPKNELFYRAFAVALDAAEGSRECGAPVAVTIDRGTREAARTECARSPRSRGEDRPAPAWLEPLTGPVARVLGRLARRLSAD
jgi:hypothetical protein